MCQPHPLTLQGLGCLKTEPVKILLRDDAQPYALVEENLPITDHQKEELRRASQRKEPLVTTPVPDLHWQRIGVDLCQFERHEYLVMVDYHSRWIEILHLTTATSSAVIAKMKDVFASLGFPQEVFSDNGPQFVSEQFRQFAKKCDFNHITSSPHLPNSNGEAERAVKTAKSILRQEDPWLALMIYRDTVIAAMGCSSSQLMMGRHLRTNLPTLGVQLRPSLPNPDVVKDTDKATKPTLLQCSPWCSVPLRSTTRRCG